MMRNYHPKITVSENCSEKSSMSNFSPRQQKQECQIARSEKNIQSRNVNRIREVNEKSPIGYVRSCEE